MIPDLRPIVLCEAFPAGHGPARWRAGSFHRPAVAVVRPASADAADASRGSVPIPAVAGVVIVLREGPCA
jgi:hypothetical protein